ncbi:DUF1549 domain-containing protein [Lignipirellula cremea]|uniref:Bacterial Ig-like domain (Group 2) n=1 Tax=Lignipirellula cremea TaxID=2528010 RepID=A0A518DPC1_9BACT|nr:DUF1549 domain-containing protein [Lignipirellula cremea]QDU93688.1 Bacterial Ig-like domain (group 2) [Lignipirellula cremea]
MKRVSQFLFLAGLLAAGWAGVPGDASGQVIDFPGLGPAGALTSVAFESPLVELRGPNGRAQLVLTGAYASGQSHDQTALATYSVAPAGIVTVDPTGFVTPVGEGEVKITAVAGGKTAVVDCRVLDFDKPIPINFANEITPVFTKLGCNAGGCHGKSGGQNGFKLSLLGFYPNEDYEWLVKEHRGRRIFPGSPEHSLILTKPLNKLPHGGGRRLDEGSYEWELLVRWIEQGMPYGSADDAVVERIEVSPPSRSMNRDSRQQVKVLAHYSDGSARDVTRLATYESNDTEMAESTTSGLITVFDRPGDVAVMVRFQGQVDVFRASIPLGLPVTSAPPNKNFVDQHVFSKLTSLGIPPSPVCDDSTFIRRVSLDIAGRLPTAAEAQAFVESTSPNKRDQLIDDLLASPGYGDYFANKWVMVLRNTRIAGNTGVSFRFHDWVRRAMQENMPYDDFVRNIVAATGDVDKNPAASWYTQVSNTTSQVEDTAQLFLGLRVQCARCHHHPFERWSQNDYYGFQAFFSQVGLKPNSRALVNGYVSHLGKPATARNPRNGQDLQPTGLGGQPIDLPAYEDPRHALVDWMAEPDNPFFAKALVNRYWKHFFGRGIVDPEDDMRVTNPPTNPALLDALAQSFIASDYDLRELVRTICRSNAYQLSSEPTEYNATDKLNFSSFYPRRLNAEPLYDAINQVSGVNAVFAGLPQGTRAVELPDAGFNDYFLLVFGKPQAESACECERSPDANLAQSLHLLNSTDIQAKLSAGNGRAAQLAADTERDDAAKITELYYWSFARAPKPDELELVLAYVDRKANKRQAYEDIMWAMFNTKEFLFNR